MVQISRPLSAPIYSGLRISFSDHAVGLRVALLTATALPRVYQKEHPADALVLLSLSQSGLLRRPRCLDTIQVIPLWPVTSRRQKIDLDGSKRRTPPLCEVPGKLTLHQQSRPILTCVGQSSTTLSKASGSRTSVCGNMTDRPRG